MRFSSGRYTGVTRFLRNEHGHAMSSHQILDALGAIGVPVRGSHPIPKDLEVRATILDGFDTPTTIVVKRAHGRMGRRVFAVCPECSSEVCAGHLHQHYEAAHLSVEGRA